MNLAAFPELIDKPRLCKIFGISRWTLRDRLTGWRDKKGIWHKQIYFFKWVWDGGKPKATKESVLAHLERMTKKAEREMNPLAVVNQ